VFLTVQWKLLRSALDVDTLMRRLKKRIADWLGKSTGESPVWFQWREAGKNKSDHLHLLIGVPESLQADFRRMIDKWLSADASGGNLDPKARRWRDVTPGDTLTRLRSYGAKESPLAASLGLVTARHQRKATGQPVAGQRLHVSEAVDRPLESFAAPSNVVPFAPRARHNPPPNPFLAVQSASLAA
jgi:hypothetical protein